jgi:hypothetical protein
MIDVTKLTETVTTTFNTAVNAATKQFDVTKIDLSKFDVTKVDLGKFDVTKMDMPKFDMPKFDRPKFDMPVDVPAEVDRVADLVRDVTYAGIGMWVVAAQKVDAEVRKLAAKAA